jgi:hypothetical protein
VIANWTVSVVLPVTPDNVADMVVLPADTPVASPLPLGGFVIVATAVLDDAQVTWLVIFCVLRSEEVPVAVNCCVAPVRMLGPTGVTAIEINVRDPTVAPVPCRAKSYGFSFASLLPTLTVAVRVPAALGLKRTWKLVFQPAATVLAGCTMALKSAAFAPDNATGLTVNEAVPRFWMVKVRVTVPLGKSVLPKSVWSAPLGVVSPQYRELVRPKDAAKFPSIRPFEKGAEEKIVSISAG